MKHTHLKRARLPIPPLGLDFNIPSLRYQNMSGKRDSDPRPQPWQGCALPTELFPQFFLLLRSVPLNASAKVLLFSELPNFSSIFLKKNVHFALFSEQNTHFKPYFADF